MERSTGVSVQGPAARKATLRAQQLMEVSTHT